MAKLKWPTKQGEFLNDPLYKVQHWLFKNKDDWKRAYRFATSNDYDTDDCGGLAIYLAHPEGGYMTLIGIFEDDLGILVHELSHITDFVLEDRGVKDTEASAYYNQWMFDYFRKFIEQEGPKNEYDT